MEIGKFLLDVSKGNFTALNQRLKRTYYLLMSRIIGFAFSMKNKHSANRNIPIIINNKNRYTYLIQLIAWLEDAGMKKIIILDNDSTYPPLLEYYQKTKHEIIYLGKNVGHMALWQSGWFKKRFRWSYFIYTDPDVLPVDACPKNFIDYFMDLLNRYPMTDRVGFGLKIDDLPDCYDMKNKVVDWEKQFWENEIEKDVYHADIDTTFALYRPFLDKDKWFTKSLRTGGDYVLQHLPWYEDSKQPTEETLYYLSHVRTGSTHWTEEKK